MASSSVLPAFSVFLAAVILVLQLVVLPSTHWARFYRLGLRNGRFPLGGRYGLWQICYYNLKEDTCAPEGPDGGGVGGFDLPSDVSLARAASLLHLALLAGFSALAVLRWLQATRRAEPCLGPGPLTVTKISLALLLVVLSITVAIAVSIGQRSDFIYRIERGWALWGQISIIALDILLLLVCAFENIQYWQLNQLSSEREVEDDYEFIDVPIKRRSPVPWDPYALPPGPTPNIKSQRQHRPPPPPPHLYTLSQDHLLSQYSPKADYRSVYSDLYSSDYPTDSRSYKDRRQESPASGRHWTLQTERGRAKTPEHRGSLKSHHNSRPKRTANHHYSDGTSSPDFSRRTGDKTPQSRRSHGALVPHYSVHPKTTENTGIKIDKRGATIIIIEK